MTTIQPIKNDQAVNTLASTAAQAASTANSSQFAGRQKSVEKLTQSTSLEQKPDVTTSADSESVFRLQSIQAEKSTITVQAKAVSAATAVEEKLGEVKDALNGIVKNYPPFLLGDEKRIQYLMSISSVREQIEKMTIPPDQAKTEVNLMWTDLFKGVIPPVLEPYGPTEATDPEVAGALTTVTDMQQVLTDKRTALEQQISLTSTVSAESAGLLSQSARQHLGTTQLPLTSRFTEALKGL